MDKITPEDETNDWLSAPSQRTLSDFVADQLRQAILSDKIQPGQRLVEQELAESLKTSRGPVRDALKMLESEGLIMRQSHRGAFVAELKPEDVVEIYTLREAVENLAMRFAIRKATDEQIDELSKIVYQMEQLAQRDYTQLEATDLDMEFHYTLCKISGHTRLLNTWVAMSAQIRLVLLKHRLWNPKDHRERSISWHARIVDSLRQRDVEQATKELHTHLSASKEWIHADINY
jgi:DNA-binding GntR family transcriptional regulator